MAAVGTGRSSANRREWGGAMETILAIDDMT